MYVVDSKKSSDDIEQTKGQPRDNERYEDDAKHSKSFNFALNFETTQMTFLCLN